MTTGLNRFIAAQDPVFPTALSELRSGRKQGHWMWFIFPQARSLGRSSTSRFYGLVSLGETEAYLRHPVLGDRLRRATEAATRAETAALEHLFGSPDDLKFRSSMTLFDAVSRDEPLFADALMRWGLERDAVTLDLVDAARRGPDRL